MNELIRSLRELVSETSCTMIELIETYIFLRACNTKHGLQLNKKGKSHLAEIIKKLVNYKKFF